MTIEEGDELNIPHFPNMTLLTKALQLQSRIMILTHSNLGVVEWSMKKKMEMATVFHEVCELWVKVVQLRPLWSDKAESHPALFEQLEKEYDVVTMALKLTLEDHKRVMELMRDVDVELASHRHNLDQCRLQVEGATTMEELEVVEVPELDLLALMEDPGVGKLVKDWEELKLGEQVAQLQTHLEEGLKED